MEVIKRQISLEDSTDRNDFSTSWGTLTAETFFINIFLTQNIDDMGMFTDMVYFPNTPVATSPVNYSILINKLIQSGITSPFMFNITPQQLTNLTETDYKTLRLTGNTDSSYFAYSNSIVSGFTDTNIEDVFSYDQNDRLKVGLNIDAEIYVNYLGDTINGVTRVYSDGDPIIYVVDAANNQILGTDAQNTGIQYKLFSGETRTVTYEDGVTFNIPLTEFRIRGEGINETNIALSALTKEEYLFGIISKPEVQNDVFIDRGVTSVFEAHLKLSEIKNMAELINYNNGYYNITKT